MNWKLFLFILLFSCVINFGQKQWESYTNKGMVTSIIFDSNNVWTGTAGGLIKLNYLGDIISEFERDEGLCQNNITSCALDIDGKIWIGTYRGGISVYDGNKWKTYNLQNSDLGSNDITSIKVDKNGVKWIATYFGVYSFNDTTWIKLNGLPSETIYSLSIDKNDNKWIATTDGVIKYQKDSIQIYNTNNSGLNSNLIISTEIDSKNNKWFASTGAISMFGNTGWKTWKLPNSGNGWNQNIIACLAVDTNDNLYIGTHNGVYIFDGDSIRVLFNTENSDIISNGINYIKAAENGDIWFGVNGGISIYNGKTWKNIFTSKSGITSNHIAAIMLDDAGRKWIGCEGGVSIYDGESWTSLNNSNSGLDLWITNSIALDSKKSIWLGGDNGLYKFDGLSYTKYDIWGVTSIIIGNSDSVWVSNWEGLHVFDGMNWYTFNELNSDIPSDNVQAIAIDKDGNKWIGTDGGGAAKLVGLHWVVYNTLNSGLTNDHVRSVAVDLKGQIWFATDSGTNSVIMFDGIKWDQFYSTYFVSKIIVDEFDNKWFGTTLNGLLFYDNNKWEQYDILNSGINDDEISCIAVDDLGSLWIGTEYGGVSKFSFSSPNKILQIPNTERDNINLKIYPSPFNSSTKIFYSIPLPGQVTLKVYDVIGKEIITLVNEEKFSGDYEIRFESKNISSGIYFCRIQVGNLSNIKKLILLR